MDALALELCRVHPIAQKLANVAYSMRLVHSLTLFLSFPTGSIHLSMEAGVPAYKLVSEINNFQTLSVNEIYQLWDKFST